MAQVPATGADASINSGAADATKLRCAQAYEMSQRFRQDGKLLRAHEQALTCAQAACPALLSGDCTRWLVELEASSASVVVEVRDARGQPIFEARVDVDGEQLASTLVGRALALDPGERHFRVTLPTGETLERDVVVTEGKKGQSVRFEVAPARAATRPTQAKRLPLLAYGAAGFAVLGGLGFGYFGLQGRDEEKMLEGSCAPRCTRSDVTALKRTYLAADASLGVGVVALGLFGYLWLSSGEGAETGVGAAATNDGAALSFRRRF